MTSPEQLALLLSQIETGPDGDRKIQLLTIEHLAAATRAHVTSSEAVTAQMAAMTSRMEGMAKEVRNLAIITAKLEDRSQPLNDDIADHEKRLRQLEQADGVMRSKGRLFDWFITHWPALAALATAAWALFERKT